MGWFLPRRNPSERNWSIGFAYLPSKRLFIQTLARSSDLVVRENEFLSRLCLRTLQPARMFALQRKERFMRGDFVCVHFNSTNRGTYDLEVHGNAERGNCRFRASVRRNVDGQRKLILLHASTYVCFCRDGALALADRRLYLVFLLTDACQSKWLVASLQAED